MPVMLGVSRCCLIRSAKTEKHETETLVKYEKSDWDLNKTNKIDFF